MGTLAGQPHLWSVALAFSVGCSADLTPPADPVPPQPGPVIAISGRQLSWTADSVIHYSVRNPEGAPVYTGCPFVDLDLYRDGWRRTAWGQGDCQYFCLDEGTPCFSPLAPGDSLTGTVRLTNDFIPRAGWYRFTFYLYVSGSGLPYSPPPLWPDESRVSPSFYVGP